MRPRSPRLNPLGLAPELNAIVEQVWLEMQLELVALSTGSRHIVATRAGHNLQRDEPELVIAAILALVQQARNGP